MKLADRIAEEGNYLFKFRGQIPVIFFILAIPAIINPSFDLHAISFFWISVCVSISIAGFIFRAYAVGTTPAGTSGRNTQNQVADVLNTSGVYSIVRHPLYLGNYLMWLGIMLFTFNIWYVFVSSLIYWLYYERIMLAEEKFIEGKFGKEFNNWALAVPAFIPAFGKFIASETPFSLSTVLRREYSGFLATVIGFLYVDIIRNIVISGVWTITPTNMYIFMFALMVTLALRTIKHNTNWLRKENRS
jgi:protein-S-isoprenylcysteine O-methyltransferase Ste14